MPSLPPRSQSRRRLEGTTMATISFNAGRVPLIPALNRSVVMKKDGGVSVQFRNRDDLLSHFEDKGLAAGADVFMSITCQCGKAYNYTTRDDVPTLNLVCACGRNLILYG